MRNISLAFHIPFRSFNGSFLEFLFTQNASCADSRGIAAEMADPFQIAGLMTSEINDFSTLHKILPAGHVEHISDIFRAI